MEGVKLVIRLKLKQSVIKVYPEYVSAGLINIRRQVGNKLGIGRNLKMLADAYAASDILEIVMINIPAALAGIKIFLLARRLIFLKESHYTGDKVVMGTIEGKAVYAFRDALL